MLIRDSAVFTAGKLIPGLLGTATTALLTRLLDPASYGLYGLSLVVMTFGSSILFDWLGLAALRMSGGEAGTFGAVAALYAGLVLLLAAATAVAAASALLDGPAGAAVAAGLLLTVCYAGFELAARLPVIRRQPGRYLLMNAGRGVLSLAGAATAAALTGSPAWTACGTAAGIAAGVLLGGPWPAWTRVDAGQARALLRFGLPLAASLALASAATSGTRLLLDALGSAEALGVYTAAFLLVQNTLSVAAAGIAAAGYPAAVRALDRGDVPGARRQVAANWSLLLAALAPMALGMALTAPGLARLLVGPRYVAGVAQLAPWLAAAGLFGALRAHGLDHLFQLANRPGRLAAVSAVAAALALGSAAALVPALGPLGAAVAALTAAIGSCVPAWLWGQAVWRVPLPRDAVAKVGVGCAVMAAAVLTVPDTLAAQVTAGIVAYAAAALATDLLGARGSLRSALLRNRLPRPILPSRAGANLTPPRPTRLT